MKHLTNGDQWKEGHAVIGTFVFDKIDTCRIFPPTVNARNSTHCVQVNCIPLSKHQQLWLSIFPSNSDDTVYTNSTSLHLNDELS